MHLTMELFIISILLLPLYPLAAGQEDACVPFPNDPACGCTFPDGKTIDLRSVGKQNGEPAFSVKSDEYTYTYNPCYPFNTTSACTNVAVCQEYNNMSHSLGVQNIAIFVMIDGNVVIVYSGGDSGRSSQVTLKCASGEPTFSFDKEDPVLNYDFTLSTHCACAGACSQDAGGGENENL